MKAVFDLLAIRGIEDDLIVNDAWQRYAVFAVSGVDHYFHAHLFEAAETFFDRELGETDVTIECFALAGDHDPELERHREATERLLRDRAHFLATRPVRRFETYLAVTSDRASPRPHPAAPRFDRWIAFFELLGITARRLTTFEIMAWYYRLLQGNDDFSAAADMSVREALIQRPVRYAPEWVKIGPDFVKVLTLKHLPDRLDYFAIDRILDEIACPYCFVSSFSVLDQRTAAGALSLVRNLSYSSTSAVDAAGNAVKRPVNHAALRRYEESDELKKYLEESGHLIVATTQKIILRDRDEKLLEEEAHLVTTAFKRHGFYFFEEEFCHDREFFRSLPATTFFSTRGLKALTPHGLALLRLGRLARGDEGEEFPLYLRTKFGTLFAFDSFSSRRQPWNTMVLGASGSGKSVFMNLVILSSIYPRIARYGGVCFVVDFAGAENSSYRKCVRLLNGRFIALDATARHTINPFPPRDRMMREGALDAAQVTFLQVILDLIVGNRGDDARANLVRFLILQAIERLYAAHERPRLADLVSCLEAVPCDEPALRQETVALLRGFLASPESRLLDGETTLDYGGAPLVVFDLQGLSSLTPRMRELMTFVVIQEAKNAAFRRNGYKSLLFDEAAQLIKEPRMASLIEEMYATARKYNAQIYTITQNYLSYKECNLSSKIALNTTASFILSHAEAPEAKRLVADDFGFSEFERREFEALRTVKREYALALARLQVGDRLERATVRIELSPFEYWLATSDRKDNERLDEIAARHGCSLIEACALAAAEAS